jgi:WD40 repeat protein
LAIGSNDGVLTLLCPDADWEPMGELDFSESPILAQDWCSKTLAVGREDGSVAVFDTEKAFDNFFVPLAEFSHSLPVRSVSFGGSGRFLGKPFIRIHREDERFRVLQLTRTSSFLSTSAIGGDSGVISILSSKGGWVLCNQIKIGCSILTTKWSPAGRYLSLAGSNQVSGVLENEYLCQQGTHTVSVNATDM